MKTGIITTDTYLHHDTGQGHPERADRVTVVIDLNSEFNFLFKELEECLLLNLILNTASADPGITLSAWLSILIFVISKFEG